MTAAQAFGGAKLILTCGDDLLVCLRDDVDHIPWPAHWDLPGGGAEPGESPADCALRELEEEFGLRFPADRLEAAFTFPNPRVAGCYSVLFTGQITGAEIAAIRFGDEGQCWCMMPVREYLAHPKAVPHFPAQIAHCLGLSPV